MQKQTKPSVPAIPSEGTIIHEPGPGRLRQITDQVALPDVSHLSEEHLDTILANCNVFFRLRGEPS